MSPGADMSDFMGLLRNGEFWAGAILIIAIQGDKFNQVNFRAPSLRRYRSALADLRARDFASRFSYWLALIAFCFVNFTVYILLCQLSPNVIQGTLKIFGIAPPDQQNIPYPLYVAGLFRVQEPALPAVNRVGEVSRDFVHARINVPKRLILQTNKILSDIGLFGKTERESLERTLLLLLDPEWRDSFGVFASSDFYSDRLVDLNLPTLRGTPRGQWRKDLHEYIRSLSNKELRLLVESVVMAALMAAIQKAGIRGSRAIFERLGLAWYSPTVDLPFFGVSLTIFFVLMTAASLLIDILRDPMHLALGIVADAKNQCVGLWPCDFNYVIREMVSYACPAVLAIVAGLILWATRYEPFLHESRRQVGGGWLSLPQR